MNYIIWGAGGTGGSALHFLGYNRVQFFADSKKAGEVFCGKKVISIDEMLEFVKTGDYVIVIASLRFFDEMEAFIKKQGVKKYFVFSESDMHIMGDFLPGYAIYCRHKKVSYTEALSKYQLCNYKNILVYGVNRMLPYLLSEIMFRAPEAKICVANKFEEFYNYNCLGLEVKNFDISSNGYDCVILNVEHCKDSIRNEFENYELNYDVVDIFAVEDLEPLFQYPDLVKYKDLHKGKRCFIVATGPSLRIEDLEVLHKNREICISMNRMYRSYDRTKWRADYIGMTDPLVVTDILKDIPKIPGEIFIGDNNIHNFQNILNPLEVGVNFFHFKLEDYSPNKPQFSTDATKGFNLGYTITYDFCIQMAAYMGFSEIYLLGVDNTSGINVSDKNNYFIDDYLLEEERTKYNYVYPHRNKINLAYERAEEFSRKNGFRIFNATRGGELEVFERVDFDSLFDK